MPLGSHKLGFQTFQQYRGVDPVRLTSDHRDKVEQTNVSPAPAGEHFTLEEEVQEVALPVSNEVLQTQLADYIFTSKYARYIPELERRETWEESVARVEGMHVRKFAELDNAELMDEIHWAFDMVREKRVLPSMRSMQFGGAAMEAVNARGYNCCMRHMDSIRSFAEVFWLLLCGCGVGISLTDKYLGRLPDLVGPGDKSGTVLTYVVEDSIEGWADSLEALLMCYFKNTPFSGRKFVPDFSKIRPKGAPLKTSGGKAPGHEGLKQALLDIKRLLDTIIEQDGVTRLRSVDAHDIVCHASDAVLSGGVRRSALITLFEKHDELMLHAKTGDWQTENPQRGRSNNSVLIVRDEISEEEFHEIYERTKEWGEPGYVFVENLDVITNPCGEIQTMPVTEDGICGVQMCNLTTMNGAKITSLQDFLDCTRAATIIGTLQASYTDFAYLGPASKQITEEESLLGVSMTAAMQNPQITMNPEYQRLAANVAVQTNELIARIIGIPPAARITCLKPEGSGTLALGSVYHSIDDAHAKIMFRRVQANTQDNVYRFFKMFNPHMCEPSVWSKNGTDDVIIFPIVNEGDRFKDGRTAQEFLDRIMSTQQNWVDPGTTKYNKKPIRHSVSCTVTVAPDEWDMVAKYIYENRHDLSAISLLATSGDKDYAQAPQEAVVTDEDYNKFFDLVNNMIPLDYTLMVESEDGTDHTGEAACVAGQCLV